MSDDQKSYLRIKANDFSLDLEGDPDFILSTYDSVREDVLRRLIEVLQASESASESKPLLKNKPTGGPSLKQLQKQIVDKTQGASASPAGRTLPLNAPPRDKKKNYLWVYVDHEMYNKVYVVDPVAFASSSLANFLDPRRLSKIHIGHDAAFLADELIGANKTLWSELTAEGRAKFRK